mmetsp:Transcript_18182/g.35709  ORF Transcript_18182/g.35709 Transcript_18182/m.35709 type:complete len:124 (+) Transcript_18182:605-976(+)|eukprot:CAMPEP_0171501210 /NCGR_PEP_ID=MMETSP0958-20121227/9430_1 /TAXON_ID=87120 /ORGANISM="Aurantiochytrium limacinum, Strain ATCCMYA-1381" /LENGTH=123 /DNA_ID=CAMNT_0012035997 /DNA_START=606 /DNA_END=977 /DNA_ORIENTATION=+
MTDVEQQRREEHVEHRRNEVPHNQKLVGSFGTVQEPDETTHQLLDTFIPMLNQKAKEAGEKVEIKDVADVKILGVQRQVVAGTNHKIILQLKETGNKYAVTIFEPLESARAAPTLMGIEKHDE